MIRTGHYSFSRGRGESGSGRDVVVPSRLVMSDAVPAGSRDVVRGVGTERSADSGVPVCSGQCPVCRAGFPRRCPPVIQTQQSYCKDDTFRWTRGLWALQVRARVDGVVVAAAEVDPVGLAGLHASVPNPVVRFLFGVPSPDGADDAVILGECCATVQFVRKRAGEVAPRTGLEPVTHGLEGRCSIHLSYRGATKQGKLCIRKGR